MNLHDVGVFLVAFGLGGLLFGALRYHSGVRDERERISAYLLKLRREQTLNRDGR